MKPRKGTISSKLFKSLIDARVPAKQNSAFIKVYKDFHYTSAQVGLVNEMITLKDKIKRSRSVSPLRDKNICTLTIQPNRADLVPINKMAYRGTTPD